MTLRVRIFCIIVALALLTIVTGVGIGLYLMRDGILRLEEGTLRVVADQAEALVSSKLDILKLRAQTIAQDVEKFGDDKLDEVISGYVDGNIGIHETAHFIALAVVERTVENGQEKFRIVASKGNFAVTENQLSPPREYIIKSLRTMRVPVLTSTIETSRMKTDISPDDPKVVSIVCAPVGEVDDEGNNKRILFATLDGMFFSDLMQNFQIWSADSDIVLCDGEGTVVASARFRETVLERVNYIKLASLHSDSELQSLADFFAQMIQGQPGRNIHTMHGEQRIAFVRPITGSPIGLALAVTAPVYSSGPYQAAVRALILISIICLTLSGVVAFFTSGYLALPFSKIEEQNRHLAQLNETVQRQAAKIQAEHIQTKTLLDAMPMAAQLWSKTGGVIECNEAAVRIFQLQNKQEFFERFYDLSPKYQPDGQLSHEKALTLVEKACECGRCVVDWTHQQLDGTPIPAEVTIVQLNNDGDSDIVAVYVQDMRERDQMVAGIKRRDSLLSTVNKAATVLLATAEEYNQGTPLLDTMELMGRCLNVDRVQVWQNEMIGNKLNFVHKIEWLSEIGQQKAEVPLGLKFPYSQEWENMFLRDECINAPLSNLSPNEQAFLLPYDIRSIVIIPLFLHDQFWGFFSVDDCVRERTFSDEEIDILRSASLMIISAMERYAMTQDLRSTASQLEIALRTAQEASQAKSNFLARVSHEMRTPLNAIIGFSELAVGSGEAQGELAANLEKIYNSSISLLGTINDLLDISKIEAGKFEMIPVPYELPSLINDTAALNSVRVGSKPIKFSVSVAENLPNRLFGDELRLKQILNNLLSNAIKYTREGEVTWSITGEGKGDAFALVSRVSDTGIGIREEHLSTLFTEYHQIDAKANRKIEGTGLGLAIVKNMVNLMGGTIAVESEHGKGSTFTVTIPQRQLSNETIGKDVAYNLSHMRHFQTKLIRNSKLMRLKLPYVRVLVVDDVQTNLDVARGMLKPYEIQVDCVLGGQQAIDAMRDTNVRYNAIFMDHMMPGMDGIEATQKIREIGTEYAKSVPIIALTANAIVGNEEMFLKNGFQAFLSKPIDIMRLDLEIRRWLRDKSRETDHMSEHVTQQTDSETGEIEGLDKEKALIQFGGSEETLWIVLQSYVDNTPALLEKIRTCTEEELTDYTLLVHGIKGTSYGICANVVGKQAESLEHAARQGDFKFISEHNTALIEATEALIERIKAVLQKHGPY